MNEEEKKAMKNDILFQIDMQLYDEFNDTIATMNDHLGDIYSLRDIEEVEKAEKDREIKLLREAIKKQQKELDKLKNKNKDLLRKLRNRVKQVKKLEKYALYKKEFSRLNKELEKKDREIQIKNNYLDLIWQIGYDYDGLNKVESLKELIDELVDYAIKAKKNDDKSVMYEGNRGKEIINQNILFEKVDETNG